MLSAVAGVTPIVGVLGGQTCRVSDPKVAFSLRKKAFPSATYRVACTKRGRITLSQTQAIVGMASARPRTFLVTGASSGLGLEFVEQLLNFYNNTKVVATTRRRSNYLKVRLARACGLQVSTD